MGEARTLLGHPIPPPSGQPNEDIVAQLEDLLKQAKDGQILAFAYCLYRPADITGFGWNPGAFGFHLASAIMSLQYGYAGFLKGVEP
jgi:hypothetical protein